MNYKDQLEAVKQSYPFSRWEENSHPDPEDDEQTEIREEHSPNNCKKVKEIFDKLIDDLIEKGANAKEENKVELFKVAVLALNELDNENVNFILTGEREDLCDLLDQITIAAGLDPENYSNGDGIADQWREW